MTKRKLGRQQWRRRLPRAAVIGAAVAVLLGATGPAIAQEAAAPPPAPPAALLSPRLASARPIRPVRDIRLFNGRDLSGWYTFFPSKGVNRDPEQIITVQNGVIRVTGKEFGYFATEREYAGYHLVFEVKWGEKKWPPRENAVRDSGVLVHCIGPDKVWIKSFECQIQEGDFGDIHHVSGISSVVNGTRTSRQVVKKSNHEKPHGQWNTVEVICDGDTVTNIVNGVTVNVATGVNQAANGTGAALIKGRIAFQSEGAEVFYRNIVIKPIRR